MLREPKEPVETLPRIVTLAGLCKVLGVGLTTGKAWRRAGIIVPVVEIGGILRFDLADSLARLAAESQRHSKRRGPRS